MGSRATQWGEFLEDSATAALISIKCATYYTGQRSALAKSEFLRALPEARSCPHAATSSM